MGGGQDHVNRKPRSGMGFGHATLVGIGTSHIGIQIATGDFALLGLLGARGAKGLGLGLVASGRESSGNKIKRGWAIQLPNSLEARSRASETEPDRLGRLEAGRDPRNSPVQQSRARVSDSSQARRKPTSGRRSGANRGRVGSEGA